MKLINFSNQLAAGPKNISLNFIREILSSAGKCEYIFFGAVDFGVSSFQRYPKC